MSEQWSSVQQAKRTVHTAIERSASQLGAAGIVVDVTVDPLKDGRYEIGIHFSRDTQFVDVAFALFSSQDQGMVRTADLEQWAMSAVQNALAEGRLRS